MVLLLLKVPAKEQGVVGAFLQREEEKKKELGPE